MTSPDHIPQRLLDLGFSRSSTDVVGELAEYLVPPLCTVLAGPFLMGSDPMRDRVTAKKSWAKQEQPQHTVTLSTYQVARYPTTVAEYACFVRAGHREPLDWKAQLGRLDHPVVYVSWYDAMAYTVWLTERAGQPWRLPSEAEWEKAARGTDGRVYPWGDTFDKARCNTSESRIRTTTSVGSYPAIDQKRSGASPYGAEDLAGNVWEWTASRHDNSTMNRVLRGGSWRHESEFARAACRNDYNPGDMYRSFGFRLVFAAPIS